jgi:hypothetical protein
MKSKITTSVRLSGSGHEHQKNNFYLVSKKLIVSFALIALLASCKDETKEKLDAAQDAVTEEVKETIDSAKIEAQRRLDSIKERTKAKIDTAKVKSATKLEEAAKKLKESAK